MYELGWIYQPQLRVQDHLRTAEKQRLIRMVMDKKRSQHPRPQRRSR